MNKRVRNLLYSAAIEAADPIIEAFASTKIQVNPRVVRDTLRSVVASFAENKKVSLEATASDTKIPYIASGDLIATAYSVYTQGNKRDALAFVLQAFAQDDMELLAETLTHVNEQADDSEENRQRALFAASGDEDEDIAAEDDGEDEDDSGEDAVDMDAEDDGGEDMTDDSENDDGEESDDEIIDSVVGDETDETENVDPFSGNADDNDESDAGDLDDGEPDEDEDEDSEVVASDDNDDDDDDEAVDPLPQQKKEGMAGTKFPTLSAQAQRAIANRISLFGDDESRTKASNFLRNKKSA